MVSGNNLSGAAARSRSSSREGSWEEAVRTSLKYGLILSVAVGLWIASGIIGLVSPENFVAGSLLVQTVLFVGAIPLSLIIQADVLSEYVPLASVPAQLCAALVVTVFNFSFVALTIGLLRDRKKNENEN